MIERTRRENIVRFMQQSVAVAAVIWVATLIVRWSTLAALPGAEAAGYAIGWLISCIPYGMLLTAIAWGFRLVVKWVLRN